MDMARQAPVSARAAADVAAVEARCERVLTPCGDGHMVWHVIGEGSDLVLLHGGFGSWLHWYAVIDRLAARHRLLIADLPGLGDSADAPPPYDADSIAAIVADGLSRLLPGARPAHVAGFSFGGVIGGHLAAGFPALVRTLTLVGSGGTGLGRAPRRPMRGWRGLDSGEEVLAAHRHNLAALMLEEPASIDDMAVYIQWYNTLRARTRSAPISLRGTLRETLPRVVCPLAGIWGELDITAVGYLDARREFLRSIHAGAPFHIVPGAGHWVMYETPQAYADAQLQVLDDFEA